MTRCVYVNGRYLPHADAAVSVEDRGFQFADSVYEVIEVCDGAFIDLSGHLYRLSRSLSELAIPPPLPASALKLVIAEMIRRNRVTNGIVYLQVSRGAAPRDFALPPPSQKPTLVCLARSIPRASFEARAATGIAVKSMPDTRWARCDLKTVMLLPSVLAKAAAKAEDAQEAWFVDREDFVTEGASSNAWIVTPSGALQTRPIGPEILAGVTRATLKRAALQAQLEILERPFTIQEAINAPEAFVTSASAIVMPVIRIDGHPIGNGLPGLLTLRLRAVFHASAEKTHPF